MLSKNSAAATTISDDCPVAAKVCDLPDCTCVVLALDAATVLTLVPPEPVGAAGDDGVGEAAGLVTTMLKKAY